MVEAPNSEEELLARCRELAGLPLAQVAQRLDETVPADLNRRKGWVGQLIERALGATASARAEPDFQGLGVELKTLPVDRRGRPRESTYVCTVPLEGPAESWQQCWLRRKLARVLWLPIQADPETPAPDRRLGMPLLWGPAADEEAALRTDWEELMDMVRMGGLERITARHGEVLQIRPKAADARALRTAVGADGAPVQVNPRGFYLRPGFTAALLRRHYHLPAGS
ncbi:MAG TPA: DNA mismatch repair endonuclease MutH [Gammaproteobacteria bacterium]|nr:DNA mismatch repair endonuclease MutH [Gammaproteobacteria bacterium]